jgi:hypothetical protein
MALLKEGCVWATSGMRSSWVLPVEDKEEVKAKYLEYKQRGYEVDIRATDKTMHMPSQERKIPAQNKKKEDVKCTL